MESLIDGTSVYLWIYHVGHEPVMLFSRLLVSFFSAKCADWLVSTNTNGGMNANSPWLFEGTKATLNVLMTYMFGFNRETLRYIVRNTLETNSKAFSKKVIALCNYDYDYRAAKSFPLDTTLAKLGGFLLGLFLIGGIARQHVDALTALIIERISEHIVIPYN